MRTLRSLLPLIVLLLAAAVSAQTTKPPTTVPGRPPTSNFPSSNSPFGGGMARVEIRVNVDSNAASAERLFIEVSTPGGSIVQQTFTDSNGVATLSLRQGQNYNFKVSGNGVHPAYGTFGIDVGQSFVTEMVGVKAEQDAKNQKPGNPVSVALLKAPDKARKEYEEGMKDFKAEKYDSAKAHLKKATEIYPQFDWAYNNLGVVYMRTNDIKSAHEAFAKAVEVNDHNSDATRNLARLELDAKNFTVANDLLNKSIAADPGNMDTLYLLTFTQYKTGNLDAALKNAEKLYSGPPGKYSIAHIIAGNIREQKGDRAGAEKEYETFLKESPDAPEARFAKEGLSRLQAKN